MKKSRPKSLWWVYLLACADGSLYCGVTTDLSRRLVEHNTSPKGARYTRARRPVALAWSEKRRTRSLALKRECAIKRLTRKAKQRLVSSLQASHTQGAPC